ncbi:MAG: hypothetical protein H6680_02180 [Desulfobacteraceae bacterium]|nr:hypothetical protein [Desulfobacteraceae bacterium]
MFDFIIAPVGIGIIVLLAVIINTKNFIKGIILGGLGIVLAFIFQVSIFFTSTSGENYAKQTWNIIYDANEPGFFTVLFAFVIPGLVIITGFFALYKVQKEEKKANHQINSDD